MIRVAVMALAMAGLVAGCSTDVEEPTVNDQDVAAIKDALYAKGTAEEELARLEPLVIEMADAVVGVVPNLTWFRNRDERRISCEAVPGDPSSASALTLRNVVFDGPIPDDAWPQALSRVQDIAARVGATELQVRADGPGNHDVLMVGDDKVQFGLGTLEAGVISARTGCHLTLSDQDRYSK
ncbi:LppA family lipoprotein [Rhodococcus sp. NPDC076796]|uniref:LppA family lipoprotein n=1 Tax=Rhodococcus sp. NPDC076796 TaxID=3154859 RepID=UPI00344E1273